MAEILNIQCTEIGDDYIVGTMPVNNSTHQAMGRLHGGASVALLETMGSMGSALIVDLEHNYPIGLEVNANHVGGMTEGVVEARANLVHEGRKTHVWQVNLRDQSNNKLICTGRLTVMILDKK